MSVLKADLDTLLIELRERGAYLDWEPGETEAALDGVFTAKELRLIADCMDAECIDRDALR